MGAALKIQGRPDEAIACYRRALELNPRFAGVHATLGNALRDQGKLSDALAAYRRALELAPNYAAAHNGVGAVLEECGDLAGAETAFRSAVRHDRGYAFAHYKLAGLLGGRLPEADLAAMCGLLEVGAGSGGESRAARRQADVPAFRPGPRLGRAGPVCRGRRDAGRGNALQLAFARKGGREYDPAKHNALVAGMIEVCTPEFFARVREFGSDSELPVFVVGLPRSGTTLVEQILASHSRVFGGGELHLVGAR